MEPFQSSSQVPDHFAESNILCVNSVKIVPCIVSIGFRLFEFVAMSDISHPDIIAKVLVLIPGVVKQPPCIIELIAHVLSVATNFDTRVIFVVQILFALFLHRLLLAILLTRVVYVIVLIFYGVDDREAIIEFIV